MTYPLGRDIKPSCCEYVLSVKNSIPLFWYVLRIIMASVIPSCLMYSTMFAYYDLFYRDKDYEAEAKYVSKFLKGSTVLDLGCGTGRHGHALIDLGYEVFGTEANKALAQHCRFPCLI